MVTAFPETAVTPLVSPSTVIPLSLRWMAMASLTGTTAAICRSRVRSRPSTAPSPVTSALAYCSAVRAVPPRSEVCRIATSAAVTEPSPFRSPDALAAPAGIARTEGIAAAQSMDRATTPAAVFRT